MNRVPLGRTYLDPRRRNNLLDTCAFDPKYAPEHEAAQRLRAVAADPKNHICLVLAHSNQKEVDHPNTPSGVKQEAAGMLRTIETDLTEEERNRRAAVHKTLTGNGKPEKYASDAAHVFEAGKYVGYFITTDQRILDKREELQRISGATIVKPTEWLSIFAETEYV